MKALKHFFLFLVIVSVTSCSNSDSNPPMDIVPDALPLTYYEELDIPYGIDSDQTFDLYLPAGRTTTTKLMILVHGGGWSSGDKSDMNLLKDLIQQDLPNFAIANINYRLADETNNPYPMQIDDITSVVDYLKSKQDDYVYSNDYGFIGISAGAHLSLLWSYAFDAENNTKMVCSIVGPTNFTDPAYLNNTNPDLQELIALYGIDASTEFLEEVSPYHQVTSNAPPTILFYGGQDPLVPQSQGIDMRDRLDELGVINEFTLYPDAGHGWVGLELLDTWTKLRLFTETYLD